MVEGVTYLVIFQLARYLYILEVLLAIANPKYTYMYALRMNLASCKLKIVNLLVSGLLL